jgi:hypothetical protein
MTDLLKLSWYLFKWSMVALGVVTTVVLAWEKYVPKTRALEWRMVMAGGENCEFAFQAPKEKWIPDSQHGSNSLIRSDATTTTEPVFLSFERHWTGSDEKGGWYLPVDRGCTLESKGTLKTLSGATARMFLASNCQPKKDSYVNYGTKYLLYGYVTLDEQADYMWLASNDKSLLFENELDLKGALQSHSLTLPSCVDKRKKQR